MKTLSLSLPKPHAAQAELLREMRRFNVLCTGRRFGKTTLGVLRLAKALEGQPVAWFAPSYRMLAEVWREVKRRYAPVVVSKSEQLKRLELLGGGSIEFWSLDKPDAARGRKYAHVVIDEAATVRELETAWQEVIRPTLTDLRGSADFLSTPKGEGFFKQLFEKAAPAEASSHKPSDWYRAQRPSRDNPRLDPAELEAARRELPELVFRQEYLAEFIDAQGARLRREWLRYGRPPRELRGELLVTMGVDLALSTRTSADYTALAVLGRGLSGTGAGKLYVLEVLRRRVSFYETQRLVAALAAKWQPQVIAVEQVQYQAALIEELLRSTRLNVRGVRPKGDKLSRFQALEARYQQGLVVHAPGLPSEFEQELLSFPLANHDDMVDALVYAYVAPVAGGLDVSAEAVG